jgi:uncharacterized protein HemX
MNASTWQTIGVIAAIVLGIGGIYFSARSSSRESARMIAAEKDRAVADAKAPLLEQIRDLTKDLRDARGRIDQLEDELRRGRGYGGDDRAGR